MQHHQQIVSDTFTDVCYQQFAPTANLRRAMRVAAVLTWPITLPMAMVACRSDFVFRTCSEILAIIPFVFGIIIRSEFYRWTLRQMGDNVAIGFGTIFLYRDIAIGSHVLIGNYNVVHHCDFGSYVLTADHCQFLSGSRYHNFDRIDVPMALQGGRLRRIRIGDDCWIGATCGVRNALNVGSVGGGGSIVTLAVAP
ncbi:MAG: acyltransferase [Planctomycetota bacterium]